MSSSGSPTVDSADGKQTQLTGDALKIGYSTQLDGSEATRGSADFSARSLQGHNSGSWHRNTRTEGGLVGRGESGRAGEGGRRLEEKRECNSAEFKHALCCELRRGCRRTEVDSVSRQDRSIKLQVRLGQDDGRAQWLSDSRLEGFLLTYDAGPRC